LFDEDALVELREKDYRIRIMRTDGTIVRRLYCSIIDNGGLSENEKNSALRISVEYIIKNIFFNEYKHRHIMEKRISDKEKLNLLIDNTLRFYDNSPIVPIVELFIELILRKDFQRLDLYNDLIDHMGVRYHVSFILILIIIERYMKNGIGDKFFSEEFIDWINKDSCTLNAKFFTNKTMYNIEVTKQYILKDYFDRGYGSFGNSTYNTSEHFVFEKNTLDSLCYILNCINSRGILNSDNDIETSSVSKKSIQDVLAAICSIWEIEIQYI
jgi:hypothetical protein